MRPKRAAAAATALQPSSLATSAWASTASAPWARTWAAVSSASAVLLLKLMMTALAPPSAVCTAIERPSPVEAPVTTTTAPSKSLLILVSLGPVPKFAGP